MRNILIGLLIGLLILLVLVMLSGLFIDAPLRGYMERELDQRVQGYSVQLEKVDFHPIGLSVDLENVTITQDAQPDPPLAHIPRWTASLQWGALLHGRIVSDHLIDSPTLHITLSHARKEAEDEAPLEERGWQEAVLAVYPVEINRFEIRNGDLTYIDADASRPLRMSGVRFEAGNIRNIESGDRDYPSSVRLEGELFESGRVAVDGRADFLADPHPGIRAEIVLTNVELERFLPVTGRYNVQLREGSLAAEGTVEYAPSVKMVSLRDLRLDRVGLDYVHSQKTAATEKHVAEKTSETAEELSNAREPWMRIDHARITNSEFGFVNEAVEPDYRVFLSGVTMDVKHFSNHLADGTTDITLEGQFMGTGDTKVTGTFRPETKSPDFDLHVKIERAKMPSMNDLFRAYGEFDVAKGLFTFYSELNVQNGEINGYIKPLFMNMEVYDRRQDREKGLVDELYEGLVGSVSELLESEPREQVATKTEMSGDVGNPDASTWQLVVNLVQNAFFQTILPGFEKHLPAG